MSLLLLFAGGGAVAPAVAVYGARRMYVSPNNTRMLVSV